jgi:hypothetical protein
MRLLIVIKNIFNRFFNCVGHYNDMQQVVEGMFWYYEHF